ncbi:hypothetical protein QO004_000064 [Rhizobium mesoamericanum]|uniref:DUF982 domain-containing protein n=1 Tax=Rhizobium mesoamericanum TaxID=1079800 RepID=UPI00278B9F68|nr:DUF982 domain-containing protein [Rhizobium mesoamericanum]MDQ0558291.1 hypothetical protein [Rhizobium mesoamericanum]
MSEYVGEHLSIRDAIVCIEKRKGVNMRRHSTLGDIAYSHVFRWPEDCRGKEWQRAQLKCLAAMEGKTAPEKAREAFLDAARAAEMLMMKEEYIQVRGEKRPRKGGSSAISV